MIQIKATLTFLKVDGSCISLLISVHGSNQPDPRLSLYVNASSPPPLMADSVYKYQ